MSYSMKDPESLLRNDNGGIPQVLVRPNGFNLVWNNYDFPSNGEYTVGVRNDFLDECEVQRTCNNGTLCIFNSNTDLGLECDFDSLFSPCHDINVTVSGQTSSGTSIHNFAFKLAPAIGNGDIVPQLALNDSVASITWDGPVSSDINTACATRAIVILQLGNELWNSTTLDASLDATNTHQWTLDECQSGNLTARVHYVTINGYETDRLYFSQNSQHFKGVGVTEVNTTVLAQFCAIEVRWDVACSDADHYNVAWGGEDSLNITWGTFTTITGLNADSYTVSVQAFRSDGEKLGDQIQSSSSVLPPKAPIAPRVNDIVGSDNTPNKLAVSWEPSTTYFCIGNVTGYIITYHKTGDSDDTSLMIEGVPIEVAQSPYDLVGLEHCTDYTVSVAAKWSRGTGESTTMKGKTGSQAPSKPIVGVETVTTTSIGLSWAQPAADSCPIGEYRVRWNSTSQGSGEDNVGFATSYTITGLSSNTTYTINVDARSDDDKTITSENIIINTDNQEQDIKVKSQLQYGVINITWTPWNDEEFYIVSWDSNTEIANRPEYIIRENEYDGNSTAIQISVCPTMDKARCSVAADRSLQTIVHPIQNLTAEINDDVLLAIWEYSDTNNDEEAIILWDGITDSTSESTWQTDQVNGAPQNVCVSAVIEDDTSRWECTIAEDNNGNGGARLVYSQNVLIPAAIAMIFGILRFNW